MVDGGEVKGEVLGGIERGGKGGLFGKVLAWMRRYRGDQGDRGAYVPLENYEAV